MSINVKLWKISAHDIKWFENVASFVFYDVKCVPSLPGIKPAPRIWLHWNMEKLEPPNIKMREEILNAKKKKCTNTTKLWLKSMLFIFLFFQSTTVTGFTVMKNIIVLIPWCF